jgi:hypothetical protein
VRIVRFFNLQGTGLGGGGDLNGHGRKCHQGLCKKALRFVQKNIIKSSMIIMRFLAGLLLFYELSIKYREKIQENDYRIL